MNLAVSSRRGRLVALHAVTGTPAIPADLIPTLLAWLGEDDRQAAAELSRRHEAVEALLDRDHRGDHTRLWAFLWVPNIHPGMLNRRFALA